ncbi:hypothetical protein [Mycobacterium sp. 3519A]|uniref:DUF6924 domain-containing protein n=1 Tax=Mycobacterium sp. 3519A TaxID=2057184 RepID=UPI001F1FF2F4|nr:hypothetical protein [Mycobacterium sp. 3519A]
MGPFESVEGNWKPPLITLPVMPVELPSDLSLLIRTDFTDDNAWRAVCKAACAPDPEHGFRAFLTCIDDPELDGATVESLIPLVRNYFFVVDNHTITDPEHPILAVAGDPDDDLDPGTSFRVIPSAMWSPENNLSLGNMLFEDFVDAAGDGVFRGFA